MAQTHDKGEGWRESLRRAWQRWKARGKRPVLGLALSGGNVRGVAHIGVLAVLEEAGIRPDLVAGTSAGSLVGAFYCAGWDSARLLQEIRNFSWREVARPRLPDPMGLLDSEMIEEWITRRLGDIRFENLDIPFAAVATDLVSGERVVLREGPVAPAVRASCAIPGLFSPYVTPDGRILVDGGVVDNLPVRAAREMGAEAVLAVNVSSTTAPLGRPPRNVLEVLEYAWRIHLRTVWREGRDPDWLVEPDIPPFPVLEVAEHADEVYQAGYQAMKEVLPQVSRALRR